VVKTFAGYDLADDREDASLAVYFSEAAKKGISLANTRCEFRTGKSKNLLITVTRRKWPDC